MPLTSPYSDEALEHLAQPDPLDDLIRASPPREGLVARAAATAIVVFVVGILLAPIGYSTAIPIEAVDAGQADGGAGRVRLRADAAALDEASRNALAALSPGAAVTLVGNAGVARAHLLDISGVTSDGVAIDVRLSPSAGFEAQSAERAVLRVPAGRRSVAAVLTQLASRTAFD